MASQTNNPGEDIAAAKARLIEAAKAFDPLEVVRVYPLRSAAAAAGAGMLLGAGSETLKSAANAARAIGGVVATLATIVEHLRERRPAEEPPHPGENQA